MEGDGARRAPLLSAGRHAGRSVVPDTVVRGVTMATVAAVAATGGAVAVAGSLGPAPDVRAAAASLTTGAVVPAAGRSVLTIPVPQLVTPGTPAPAPTVLDPAALSRAVARAQADARRIAGQARDTTTVETPAPVSTDPKADEESTQKQDAEDKRTAERARRAGRAGDPGSTAVDECALDTSQLGPVKSHVRTAAEFLGCRFGEPTVLGVAGRSNASDHPRGLAVDFMVDRATGDRLAACAIHDRDALGISYVIWRQRIDTGDGFRAMPDRGSPTANHFDHVHVSFDPSAGSGDPATC